MSSKRSKAQNSDAGGQKISSFFKPDGKSLTSAGIKRSREEERMSLSPPAKRSSNSPPGSQENSFSPPPTKSLFESSLDSQENSSSPPPAERSSDSSPKSQENGLSPEQKSRMERNRLEAEAKIIAKKFGTKEMGLSWVKALLPEFKKPYMQELITFVSEQRSKYTVYPPPNDVFTWTTACPVNEVKVVILGQDPYHGPNQAHGLCFSVRVGISIPPSLLNMYKELSSDIEGFKLPDHGYLVGWAKQGVLLLNACLTVRAREANSHAGKGWENLTDAVIHWLNDKRSGLVFLLWGSYAQKKGSFINKKKHCVLKSPHPSPLSAHRGFLGNKHFSQTNTYLVQHWKKPIDWSYLPKTLDA